jgi:hypothetical protein
MRLVLALVLLVALSACSSGQDPPKSEPRSTPSPRPEVSESRACAEVRAGIDAFNAGEFRGTVDHFKAAVPLARDQADANPSQAAEDLLEAVTYYAELAPEDYPESARSSPEFAKYKTITLGQCVSATEPLKGSTNSPGVPA